MELWINLFYEYGDGLEVGSVLSRRLFVICNILERSLDLELLGNRLLRRKTPGREGGT